MIQRTMRYLKEIEKLDNITITTCKEQTELLYEQLGYELNIVAEPLRRDTFPAIALTCAYLYSKGVSVNEPIIVMPCDSFAYENYYSSLKLIEMAVVEQIANIVLLGVSPKYPSSKFGYILPFNSSVGESDIMPVKAFIEKPDIKNAERLIKEGALWNSGVCGFELGYLLELTYKYFKTIDYETLIKNYQSLHKLSFSYEILENAKSKSVISYDGIWKDIGTWNDMTAEMRFHQYGNVISESCNRSYIINDLKIPIICIGCDNLAIIASENGILVSNRDMSENIKHLLEHKPKNIN